MNTISSRYDFFPDVYFLLPLLPMPAGHIISHSYLPCVLHTTAPPPMKTKASRNWNPPSWVEFRHSPQPIATISRYPNVTNVCSPRHSWIPDELTELNEGIRSKSCISLAHKIFLPISDDCRATWWQGHLRAIFRNRDKAYLVSSTNYISSEFKLPNLYKRFSWWKRKDFSKFCFLGNREVSYSDVIIGNWDIKISPTTSWNEWNKTGSIVGGHGRAPKESHMVIAGASHKLQQQSI